MGTYVLATLLYPCIPVVDPTGEGFSISRVDFTILYLGSGNAIWNHWTGGYPSVDLFSERWIPTSIVAATLVFSWCLGGWIGTHQPTRSVLLNHALATLYGFVALNVIVGCLARTIGVASLPASLACVSIPSMAGAVAWYRSRSKLSPLNSSSRSDNSNVKDSTFDHSWSRRIVGSVFVLLIFLFVQQLFASFTPTVDLFVRQTTWWRNVHTSQSGRYTVHSSSDVGSGFDLIDNTSLLWAGMLTDGIVPRGEQASSPAIEAIDPLASSSDSGPPQGGKSTAPPRVPEHYRVNLAQKGTLVVITWVSMACIAWSVQSRFGWLSGICVMLMLVTSPGLVELARLGRTEGVYGGLLAAFFFNWNSTAKVKELIGQIVIGITTLLGFVWILMNSEPSTEMFAMDSIMRFLGFSLVHNAFLIPLGLVGLWSNWKWRSIGLAMFPILIFAGMSLILQRVDRTWLASTYLLAFGAGACVNGIQNRMQAFWSRIFGTTVFFAAIVISSTCVVVFPTMDNRWLAPLPELIYHQWDSEEIGSNTSRADQEIAYPIEIMRLIENGSISGKQSAWLVGEIDDLDLAIRCFQWKDELMKSERFLAISREVEIGYVLCLTPERRAWTKEEKWMSEVDRNARITTLLQDLEKAGYLQEIPVSSNCKRLRVFRVIDGN